jgi:hypothetical protein
MEIVAIIPFILGLLQKHVFGQLPNAVIPWVNFGVCLLIAAFTTGGELGQSVELAAKWAGTAAIGHAGLKSVVKVANGKKI